jgi:hypothetical protein
MLPVLMDENLITVGVIYVLFTVKASLSALNPGKLRSLYNETRFKP